MRYIRRNNLNCEPKELFDKNIISEIKKQQSEHVQMALMIDVNENVETGKFTEEMEKLGLHSAFKGYIRDQMSATNHSGSYPISTIFIPMQFKILNAGVLQKGKGFQQSDHRNMFVNIDTATFLGSYMYKVLPPNMKMIQESTNHTSKITNSPDQNKYSNKSGRPFSASPKVSTSNSTPHSRNGINR